MEKWENDDTKKEKWDTFKQMFHLNAAHPQESVKKKTFFQSNWVVNRRWRRQYAKLRMIKVQTWNNSWNSHLKELFCCAFVGAGNWYVCFYPWNFFSDHDQSNVGLGLITSRSVKRHCIGHLVRELWLAGESEGREVLPNFQIGDCKDSLHCFCGSLNPENGE